MSDIHVAVGVIESNGRYLIARRPLNVHKGGLWEFPGGKVEPNETVTFALARELKEELDIDIDESSCRPLLRIRHAYPEKTVILNVWRVSSFSGSPHGNEGQEVRWVSLDDLQTLEFPEANVRIINALRLPELYLITGESSDNDTFIDTLSQCLLTVDVNSTFSVRLRLSEGEPKTAFLSRCLQLCHDSNAPLFAGVDGLYCDVSADGLHLKSSQINGSQASEWVRLARAKKMLVGCSVHSESELQAAEALAVDFVCISPVLPTNSHPGAKGIGWQRFSALAKSASLPVYALGGLTAADLAKVKQAGGHGVAGIGFWWHDQDN